MSKTNELDVIGHLTALRRYARSLARNDTDAEDLVQDALLRAYERRGTFRPGRGAKAWLLSILHNAFVDGRRARASEQEREARSAELRDEAMPAPQDQQLRLAETRRAFMRLPEEQRAALHLVAIEGLTFAEAAAALDVPLGTLMSRLARARATLRHYEDGATAHKGDMPPALRIVGGSDGPAD